MAIHSFRNSMTASVAEGRSVKGFPPDVLRAAIRKMAMIDAAVNLDDLRSPPGNRLEALKGNRVGQYSIRINNQWRIVFKWIDGGAEQVEIVDYH